MVRISNSLVKGLNEVPHLPKYLLVIPDMDILEDITKYHNFGFKQIIKHELKWLIPQLNHYLATRRENLKSTRIGSVSSEPTRIIWVKMLARPLSSNNELIKILKLRRKFNETLEDLLAHEKYTHIMSIVELSEEKYFTYSGHLTELGKTNFWCELIATLKRFDYHDDELIPLKLQHQCQNTGGQHPSAHCTMTHYDDIHSSHNNQRRRLPTPPPEHRTH